MHPEVKALDKELQDNRFKHQEEKRVDRIKMAIDKRKELIQTGSATNSKINFNSKNNFDETNPIRDLNYSPSSTAIREEQKRLERLKNKQIWELQSMIDFEFMMEETRRKNEEKIKLQKEKEEKIKNEKIQKTAHLSKKRIMKEAEREKRLREENEEQVKKQKLQDEEENKKRVEEVKRKEQEDREMRKKQIEAKKQEDEFRKQIETVFETQQKELLQKQKDLMDKEETRKRNLEASKNEKLMKAIKQSQKSKLKIDKSSNNNDEKLKKQKEVILIFNSFIHLFQLFQLFNFRILILNKSTLKNYEKNTKRIN